MPSQAYTSFLHMETFKHLVKLACQVSMPSRAYTSFLPKAEVDALAEVEVCQCPLGLIPHFYIGVHSNMSRRSQQCVNALSGLYLISTGYKPSYLNAEKKVSMPSRAYTSFLLRTYLISSY